MSLVYLENKKYFYHIDSNRIIHSGIRDIFLTNLPGKTIEWDFPPLDPGTIRSGIQHLHQIIFETTKQCNMSCKYCIYGHNYHLQRKPSNQILSFATAAKTLDYIGSLIGSRSKKELVIGFYGGEPLLNFSVLRQITDYCRSIFPGWLLQFTLTTNGTLLNETVIHFLIDYGFNLMVSLDGDRDNHDAKRVFPDGSGSFETILKKTRKIKEIDRDFYSKHVTFLITHSRDLPIGKVYDFFNEDERVRENPLILNFVNHLDTTYYEENQFDEGVSKREINEILRKIMDKKAGGVPLSAIEENLFNLASEVEEQLKKRYISFLADSCLFNKRLYVDAEGGFHICEKMNDRFPLGNCHTGFNFERMSEIAGEFAALIKEKCIDCEARFLCNRCYIHFAGDGKFELNPAFCEMNKKIVKRLELLIKLKQRRLLP